MRKHSYITILAAALPLLAACSLNEPITEEGGIDYSKKTISLGGEINQVYVTRASDGGFADQDRIGVYIVDYNGSEAGTLSNSGNRADNVKHTFDEASYKWKAARDIYWKNKDTHVDIYGYYPYGEVDEVNAMSFEVSKDQSTDAQNGKLGGYESSDFLWGKVEDAAPTDKVIKITFQHILAGVRVSLLEGTGFAEGEWAAASKEVLITGTRRKSTIDLATGIATPTGDVSTTGIIPVASDADFRAVVIPQDIAAGTDLISITVDGIAYKYNKAEAMSFIAGKQHNFTVTVNKRGDGDFEFTLSGESITAWENDSASHDALAREYIIINVDTPGTLDECIKAAGKDIAKVRNLKLTGTINSRDFAVMRYMMSSLSALNLKEVTIARTEEGGHIEGYDDAGDNGAYLANAENEIPDMALKEKRTLSFLTLPDNLTRIAQNAFFFCSNLTGSLTIPEGVTYIGPAAFSTCSSYTGSLSLPESLTVIRNNAFDGCNFTCELQLPAKLKYLGNYAFDRCTGLYGELHLSEALEYLGESCFGQCSNLTGSITIPQSITTVEARAFYFCYGLTGTLTLHNGITSIGEEAFCDTPLKGELILPDGLVSLGKRAFSGCDFSGKLVLPSGLSSIGDEVFRKNWRLSGTVEIPGNVVSIGSGAFAECRGIEGVIIPESVETIQHKSTWQGSTGAFENCYGLNKIVCKGTVPPYLQTGAFDGVPKDNFTLEVPEESLAQYQAAPGWCDFKRISAYRNLVIRPNVATALNTKVSRELVLNADEEWIVESQPDWVTLSQTSGKGKTELTLEFSQMPAGNNREGKIVFKLKDKDYRTTCSVTQYDYEYAEDEMITLQSASKGRGINIVLLGDGYDAKDISEGNLMKDIKEAMGHFFSIEPYKSYKDYFNVYTGVAVSSESGIGGVNTIVYNRFNTSAKGGVTLSGRNGESDFNEIFKYALNAPTVTADNLCQTLIIMIPNTSDYGGICYMYADGSAIAYCPKSDNSYPYDFRGLIQHEAGGHGFGKLGDEYIYHNAFIDACDCSCCEHVEEFNGAKSLGWLDNLSLSGKMSEVPWKHLLFHEKYKQIVDIYEGGFMHNRGVYRSEYNSCMNNDIPYYSTVSRESIVRRIKAYAGEEYSFEDFVANDNIENLPETASTKSDVAAKTYPRAMHQHAPVFMGKRPVIK
jgi:hypothetical protein